MTNRLLIQVIGQPAVLLGEGRVNIVSRKGEALLALLALNDNATMTRQAAASLLWSDRGEEHARMSLRQAVKAVRDRLEEAGYSGFHAGKEVLSLEPETFSVDIMTFIASLELGEAPDTAPLRAIRYADRIMEGLDGLDDSLQSRLRVLRQLLNDRIRSSLERRLDGARGDRAVAEGWARALVAFDPSHEPAVRYVMECRARDGDQAGALNVFNTLCEVLRDEFDTAPAAETRRLAAEIRGGALPPKQAASIWPVTQPPAQGPVIHVAGIESAIDARTAAFAAGIRFDLIARLVRFREWTVVDWKGGDAAMARPTYTVMMAAIGGGARPALSLNLRDERDGRFIWGARFDGSSSELAREQDEFVRRIAASLNVNISADRLKRLSIGNALPGALYDKWVAAQDLLMRWRSRDDDEAETLLTSIIREAPEFGPAYSALAQHANGRHLVLPGVFHDAALTEKALAHAHMAQLLDPLDAKAHLSHGWSLAQLGRFDEAETAWRNALHLNDNDPWVLTSATCGLTFCGEVDETRRLAARIRGLGVSLAGAHWSYLATIHYLLGDIALSLDASARASSGNGLSAWRIAALMAGGEQGKAAELAGSVLADVRAHWNSADPPEPGTIARWLAGMFPFRDPATRAGLLDRLAAAGLG